MKALLLAAAAASLALPAAAHAETPEEAIAYVFVGLSDGANLTRGTTTMNWKHAAGSPAVFEGHGNTGGREYDIKFTVRTVDDCDYEIYLDGPTTMIPLGHVLYAKVSLKDISGATAGDKDVKVTIAGKGFCETGRMNPVCASVDNTDLFGFIDAEHHKQVVDYMLTKVCPRKTP
jgi:hypothetical protein